MDALSQSNLDYLRSIEEEFIVMRSATERIRKELDDRGLSDSIAYGIELSLTSNIRALREMQYRESKKQ